MLFRRTTNRGRFADLEVVLVLVLNSGSGHGGSTCQDERVCGNIHFLTFAVREVAYAQDVVSIWIMVLLDVGGFLRCVLELHRHLLQLLVQLFKRNTNKCFN